MSAEGILEGNRLIAEFMGAIYSNGKTMLYLYNEMYGFDSYNNKWRVTNQYHFEDLLYNSSWDWLMPVIEQMKFIEDHQEDFFEEYHLINFKMEFFYGVELWIDSERLFLQTAFGENTLIDAIYKAVVEFIKWYNINKKK